ncbi:Bug family tripartite tricarboxylate transporter substrate binding protein [Falsiroseomonas oryzae]|uniref:Bug family tripartite tricarboxylate transporter substrate binding protein n=1 Tax=Falsiroseomonas oryzae TaxID=2766473 RepID=UPI0022EAEC9B|nr:tripartite tricarboxylate transporter substrate binding protein [Roseomonas sp. MO-31]
MMQTTRRTLLALGAAAALPLPAFAQAYPTRPVRVVVPFPPGNTSDILARLVAEEMQSRQGVTVVVENRAGASGALGVQAVTGARPDGYTLLVTTQSPLVVNPPLTRNLPYDPVRDLAPIGVFARNGFILVVSPNFPARTMAEAAAVLRAAPPGRFTAANPGLGTMSHLAMELLGLSLGTKIESVPYRGSAQALTDLAAGRVDLMIDGFASAVPQARGGTVRALSLIQPGRSDLVPEVPGLAESGVPELAAIEALSWTAMLGPAGTPPDIVAWWVDALRRVMSDSGVARRLAQTFIQAFPPDAPDAFGREIAADLAKWTRVVRDARIEPQ